MLLLLPTLLALTPPTGFTASVERLPVRVTGRASLEVDVLAGRLVLSGATSVGKTRLCPRQERAGDAVVIHCATRRLWASLERDERGDYLDVRQLTGRGWQSADAEIPMQPWSLKLLLLPDTCPGESPAARAECAFARGDVEEARRAWTQALDGPDVSLARLRLADLAMQRGEVETALSLFSKVSPVGPLGRLAHARTCELMGTCFTAAESERLANDEGLALPFARELALVTVRRELTAGRDEAALLHFVKRLQADPETCDHARAFCQKVIEVGLRSEELEARISALSAFLTGSLRHGPRELELTAVAAATAEEVGAPAFAAALLASNTPQVAPAQLNAHLLQIVRLYAAAGDRVRANVVLDYAENKLGAASHTPAWNGVRKQLGKRRPSPQPPALTGDEAAFTELTSQVALTTDLARAAAARSRAVESPQERAP